MTVRIGTLSSFICICYIYLALYHAGYLSFHPLHLSSISNCSNTSVALTIWLTLRMNLNISIHTRHLHSGGCFERLRYISVCESVNFLYIYLEWILWMYFDSMLLLLCSINGDVVSMSFWGIDTCTHCDLHWISLIPSFLYMYAILLFLVIVLYYGWLVDLLICWLLDRLIDCLIESSFLCFPTHKYYMSRYHNRVISMEFLGWISFMFWSFISDVKRHWWMKN